MAYSWTGRTAWLFAMILLLAWLCTAQELELTRKKLMDVEAMGRYMPDGEGDIGGGIRFRFNLPKGVLLGFSVNGGQIIEDMNNWVYVDESDKDDPIDQYYFFDSDISEGGIDLLLGYQIMEGRRVSPYIMTGYGGWFANFEVFRAESVTVPTDDGIGYETIIAKINKKIATNFSGYIPVTIGADIRILDWLYVSPFAGYNFQIDDMNIYSEPFDSTTIEKPIDFTEKRGKFSLGLSVKIPIYIEMY